MKDRKLQQIPIQFEVVNQPDERFTFVKIYLMHLGLNLNGSIFTKDVVERCWPSLALTPILGYIPIEDYEDNENLDFDGHKNILVIKDGEYDLKYIGQAYGCIGENCNPRWEKKIAPDGTEKEYLVCDGVLWSGKYSDVKEIIDRDIHKKQSMELFEDFSGSYDSNNNFVFSDFKFYGACLLGNKKHEAMIGACVEKVFSYEDLKKEMQSEIELLKQTLNEHMAKTQLELNQKNQLPSPTSDNIDKKVDNDDLDKINFQEKGGNTLEEKLNLLGKYSNLTEEDIKDLKSDIEKYSLEEFDTKLKEMSEEKEAKGKDGKDNKEFEMTNEQLMTAVFKALSERQVTTTDYFGDKYQTTEFRYCDIKDNMIITIDYNWSVYYSLPYSVNGDNVNIDFEGKVEYLPDWRQKENGSGEFSLLKDVLDEQIKFSVEKAIQKTQETFSVVESEEYKNSQLLKKLTEDKFSDIEGKYNELQSQFEEIQSKYTAIESEKVELQSLFSALESENKELKDFQDTTIASQRKESEDALFEMFSEKLNDEELQPIKDISMNFSIEDLEEKLWVLVAKKEVKFEQKAKPRVGFSFEKQSGIEITSGKPYDDIVSQYVAK